MGRADPNAAARNATRIKAMVEVIRTTTLYAFSTPPAGGETSNTTDGDGDHATAMEITAARIMRRAAVCREADLPEPVSIRRARVSLPARSSGTSSRSDTHRAGGHASRPVRQLKGFRRIALQPGRDADAQIRAWRERTGILESADWEVGGGTVRIRYLGPRGFDG
jgi:hypothetical protein